MATTARNRREPAKRKPRRPTNAALIAKMEKAALPKAKLRKLARKYPPPQSWYDENVNPFDPERS